MSDVDDWTVADLPGLFHAARYPISYEAIVFRLRNDDRFAAEMRLCHEWHMPHSEFTKWKDDDQDKALAFFSYEVRRCSRCGIHPDDWPDPTEPLFDAVLESCPGCAETDRFQRHIEEQKDRMPKSASDGVRIVLKKRD